MLLLQYLPLFYFTMDWFHSTVAIVDIVALVTSGVTLLLITDAVTMLSQVSGERVIQRAYQC